MDHTSSWNQRIEHQFDTICRRALHGEKVDYLRSLGKRSKREIMFCEMEQSQIESLHTIEHYPSDKVSFRVIDFEINVENPLLAEALSNLPKQYRDIVLLSYFMELSDTDISKLLNIVRRTVQYQRTSSLDKLKKYMENNR